MSMKVLAASLLAVVPMLAAGVASAGDLGGYPEPRTYEQGEYYEPPRRTEQVERVEQRDYVPPSGSYKDDPLPPPAAPPRRYSEDRSGCTPRHIIRDRMVGKGWHDFQPAELRGDIAVVRARARSGDMYVLKVHRCSGDIVDSWPVDRRPESTTVYSSYEPYYYGRYYGGYRPYRYGRRHW